ncbi:MAG TPA: carboxypeptidase-like regulatory domain-containing protein, partial [Kofleriaceae bacterium]|nr:carboxypeptidase-like regulatory domain-containing protein [Kofleriaceae bacterium]
MSEDDRDNGAAEPAARRRRIAIGIAAAVLLALGVIGVVLHRARHAATPVEAPRDAAGSAAIHAPRPPQLSDEHAQGTRLTGVVLDGAGLPVAGAEVSAELERGVPDRALSITPRVARDAGVVDAAAPGDAGVPAPVAIAPPTGADGRFAIFGIAPGRYRVRVTGSGLLAAEVRFVPVPSDEARIVVARQIAIDGSVTDGGKPVANANVGVRGEAIGGTLELKTDSRGAFHAASLPEGRYQVYAWQGANAARTIRVARLGAGPFAPVELRLEAGAIVVGRVIDRGEGTPLVAAVELRPSGDDQAPRFARTLDDGAFRIEGVPNGRWIADAFAPGFISPGGVELEAGKGVPELALVRGGAIEGRVLDASGNPVEGAAVRAISQGATASELSADVDRDRLRRFSGRTAAPAPEPSATGLDPELMARGELGVMIGPIPPLPPPGAEVARSAAIVDPAAGMLGEPPPLPTDEAHASIWVTGADGRYRILGFGKAKVTVLAQAAGFAEARSREVAIDTGQLITGVDLVVSAGTMLVGKVTDPRGAPVVGAEVTAQPKVGAPLEGFTDDDGEFKLGPLAGAVELHASAYGHVDVRREVDLPAGKGATAGEHREDIVLDIADAELVGTLEDATGVPVGGAQLEVSDGAGEGRHTTVARDGTFAIELLPRGHVRVRVDHPDYPPAELDAVASVHGDHVHLVLPLGGAAEGVLLDASSGEALAGMPLDARGPAGQSAEATTDKDGRWKLGPLRPGHWHVDAKIPGYLAQSRELDVAAAHAPGGTSVRDIRIDLARGALVGGTVRDDRGQRIGGAHVVVHV